MAGVGSMKKRRRRRRRRKPCSCWCWILYDLCQFFNSLFSIFLFCFVSVQVVVLLCVHPDPPTTHTFGFLKDSLETLKSYFDITQRSRVPFAILNGGAVWHYQKILWGFSRILFMCYHRITDGDLLEEGRFLDIVSCPSAVCNVREEGQKRKEVDANYSALYDDLFKILYQDSFRDSRLSDPVNRKQPVKAKTPSIELK